MILLYLALLAAREDNYDNYVYYRRQCGTVVNDSPIHQGVAKSDCLAIVAADKRLNEIYRAKSRAVDAISRKRLKVSQLAWIKSRNKLYGLSDDVLIRDESTADCFVAETKKRMGLLLSPK